MYRQLVSNTMLILLRNQQTKLPKIAAQNLMNRKFGTTKILENVEKQKEQSSEGKENAANEKVSSTIFEKIVRPKAPPPPSPPKGKTEKKKRKSRSFRRPKPKRRGGQEMCCTPLAENIDLEALERNLVFKFQYDIKKVTAPGDTETEQPIAIRCQQKNQKFLTDYLSGGDQNSLAAQVEEEPMIREFYVFKDGIVVFWNIDQIKQAHILDHLRKCSQNLVEEHLRRSEEDFMNVEFTRNQSKASNDTVYLNSDLHMNPIQLNYFSSFDQSETVQERFAFSHAMAASVRMSILEENLNELDDELEKCIEKMKEGKLAWDQLEAMQMIGKIAYIRQILNTTDLLNKNIYWDLDNSERVYDSMAARLNLNKQRHFLNERIDYGENFSKTVHGMLDQKKSHRLEWIIIWLIFLEVLFNFDKVVYILEAVKQGISSYLAAFTNSLGSTTLTAAKKPSAPANPEDEFAITLMDRAQTLLIYPILLLMIAIILLSDARVYRQKFRLFRQRGYRFRKRTPKENKPDPDLDD